MEVQPATYIIIDKSMSFSSKKYWFYPKRNIKRSNELAVKEFEELFSDAVKIRLRSDVQVGTLLSGGVDSTLLSAEAKMKLKNKDLKNSFCYSSRDNKDEKRFAQKAAKRLGLDLTTIDQNKVTEDYISRLRSLVLRLGKGPPAAIVTLSHIYSAVSKAKIQSLWMSKELMNYWVDIKITFNFNPILFKTRRFKKLLSNFARPVQFGFLWSIMLWIRVVMPAPIKKLADGFMDTKNIFQIKK